MPRPEPQRIVEPTLQNTIGSPNTGFVQASEGVDISEYNGGWSEGLTQALGEFGKFANALTKTNQQDFAEAGRAINAKVNQGMSLEKAVAEYSRTGETPMSIRKKLHAWVENGKWAKSANYFVRRSYMEGQGQFRAKEQAMRAATKVDEAVAAAKGAVANGHEGMIDAISQTLISSIDPKAFDGLDEYGLTVLREEMNDQMQELRAVALARAEDEISQERVDTSTNLMLDNHQQMLDVISQSIKNLPMGLGGKVSLDLDAEEVYENDPLNRQFARYNDAIFDVLSDKERREAMVAMGIRMFQQTAANQDMSYDDREELLQHQFQEAIRARENNGTGPTILSPENQNKLYGALQTELKRLKFAEENSGGDRIKGYEMATQFEKEPWFAIADEHLSEDMARAKSEAMNRILRIHGPEVHMGFVQALRNSVVPGLGSGDKEPTDYEEGAMNQFTKDPNKIKDFYPNVPAGRPGREQLEWVAQTSNSPEFQKALSSSLAALDKSNNDFEERVYINLPGMIHTAVNAASAAEFGAENFDDPGLAPLITEDEEDIAEDSVYRGKVAKIMADMKSGLLTQGEAHQSIMDMTKKHWKDLDDSRGATNAIVMREEREIAEAQGTAKLQTDRPQGAPSPSDDFIEKLSFPDFPTAMNTDDRWFWGANNLGSLDLAGIEGEGYLVWQGPGDRPLTEWAERSYEKQKAFENLPGGSFLEDLVRGIRSAKEWEEGAKQTGKWIDGKTVEYFIRHQSVHDADFGVLDEDFDKWIRMQFAKELRPAKSIPLVGELLDDALSTEVGDTNTAMRLLNRGSGLEFVGSYGNYLEYVTLTDRGWALNPEKYDNNFALFRPSEEVSSKELKELGVAGDSHDARWRSYTDQRVALGTASTFVIDTDKNQKIRGDIHEIVRGKPVLERHWATSQKIYNAFYGPYNHRDRNHRRKMSHVWLTLADQEQKRTDGGED